jgi:hypothetical protein
VISPDTRRRIEALGAPVMPKSEPMVDNQHKQISGYRDLTQAEIDAMNSIKMCEAGVGDLWREIGALPNVDKRELALAKTYLEDGFMRFVRAVARPESRF